MAHTVMAAKDAQFSDDDNSPIPEILTFRIPNVLSLIIIFCPTRKCNNSYEHTHRNAMTRRSSDVSNVSSVRQVFEV